MQLGKSSLRASRLPLNQSAEAIKLHSLIAFSLIAMLCLVHAVEAQPEGRTFVGYAFDLKSDDLLYKEVHFERVNESGGIELETRYLEPDGRTIAVRHVDFSEDQLAPHFRLQDHRTGYSEGLNRDGETVFVYRHFPDRPGPEKRRLPAGEALVADAGFDQLISNRWDRLLLGDELRAEFLVPARLRTLTFIVAKEREWLLENEPVVTFRMTASSPFVRILIGAIRVTYNRNDRSLMVYEGLSNIQGPDGKGLKVRIEFPQDERKSRPSDAARLAGPFSYWIGAETWGAVEFSVPKVLVLTVLACVWAVITPALSILAERLGQVPESDGGLFLYPSPRPLPAPELFGSKTTYGGNKCSNE